MQFAQDIHYCCPSGCLERITAEQESGAAASVKIVTWRSAPETEQESMSAHQRDASKPVKAANYAWEKAGDLKHGNGSEAATVHFNRQVEIGVRADGSRRTATVNVVRDNFQSQRTSRGNCSMAGRPPSLHRMDPDLSHFVAKLPCRDETRRWPVAVRDRRRRDNCLIESIQ
jgi:hypothetical protein